MHKLMIILWTVTFASVAHAQLPNFAMQELDRSLKIGYAVIVEDLDGDQRPDIVVVDQRQIAWYRNPGSNGVGEAAWSKHLILDG